VLDVALVVWAGEGIDLVNDILPTSEIIQRVIAQAVATLRHGVTLVRDSVSRSVR
jgi:hypothetical protein